MKDEFIDPRDQMKKISRRSFIWAGAAVLGTYGGFRFLNSRRQDGMLPWPLRRTLEFNEDVWTDAFSGSSRAPTFRAEERTAGRVNGNVGLEQKVDLAAWRLTLENAGTFGESVELTLDDIKKLPRHEFTTQLCCVEGWSMIVTWAGVRFRDFAAKYLPFNVKGHPATLQQPEELAPYVYLATPDEVYYVGMDMQSMLHPQTLLCYEMNGAPLTQEHGAPLRIVMPVKYGYKNIKRLGLIRYTTEKPRDFWAEQGYDWYAGL